jgi:hypothetical protein
MSITVKTVTVNPCGTLAVRKGNAGAFAVAYAVHADDARSNAQANGQVCAMHRSAKAAAANAATIAANGRNGGNGDGGHRVVPGSVTVLPTVVVPADTATHNGSDLHAVGAWLYAAWLWLQTDDAAAQYYAAADAWHAAQAAAADKRAAAAAKRAAKRAGGS